MASCSCGTRDKPKPVSPLSRGLSWLGRCMRLAFRNGADGHVPKSTTVAVQGVYKEPWPKNIKYEYCYLFSSSDSWSKSAKLDLKLPNHRQLAPNWKSMVTH